MYYVFIRACVGKLRVANAFGLLKYSVLRARGVDSVSDRNETFPGRAHRQSIGANFGRRKCSFYGGEKKKESSLGIFSQIALSVVKRYDPPPPPVSYYTPVW